MNRHEKATLCLCVMELIRDAGANDAEAMHVLSNCFAELAYTLGVRKENLLHIVSTCYDSAEISHAMDGAEIH